MKITNLKIENFKFHKDLEFSINNNLLIYGENGSGKSSIYESFKSNLYINNMLEQDIQAKFIHRDNKDKTLKVNIAIDTNLSINRTDNDLIGGALLEESIIYMANEKTLNTILKDKDFYQLIDTNFKYEFPKLKELLTIYNAFEVDINRNITDDNREEYIAKRFDKDAEFEDLFHEIVNEESINNIILEDFKEDFKIEFIINDSNIEANNKLTRPTIRIKIKDIDDENNLHNHFNEAKLKLISIAIYFSLAKSLETNVDNKLKLLILDDFLTSLDMSNRKLIIQYILDSFNEYQIMIFTHNIQFFNLVKRLTTDWDIKKIYYSKIVNKSKVISHNKSYLGQAKERLVQGDLESSGNFLRKEFERIANELENLLELGRVEDLGNIVNALATNDIYIKKPHKNFNLFFKKLKEIIETSDSEIIKIDKIKDELDKISNLTIDLNKKIINVDGSLTNINLKILFKKINFYNGILLNPLSHDHQEIESYQKECENVIALLESISLGIDRLKIF